MIRALDDHLNGNSLSFLNLGRRGTCYIGRSVKLFRMTAMESLRTISYLVLVAATFAATYLVTHI